MGSPRRRRKLKRAGRPADPPKPWQIQQYDDAESMLCKASLIVPRGLAIRFADALDSGLIEISPNAEFPADWPYAMRCVEFYPEAAAWVLRQSKPFEGAQLPIAFTNAVRMVSLAAMAMEREDWEVVS